MNDWQNGAPKLSTDTPQVLLAHHLKAFKLPTFLRGYDKLARQCATEGFDHTRYLLRLAELELIERERRQLSAQTERASIAKQPQRHSAGRDTPTLIAKRRKASPAQTPRRRRLMHYYGMARPLRGEPGWLCT